VLTGSRFSAPGKVRVSGLVGLSGGKTRPQTQLKKTQGGLDLAEDLA
jgi:hypothetical protein